MGFFKQSEIKKRYDIGDTLGSGNFATVKRATSKQPTQGIPTDVAIKIIDKAKVDDMQDIRREVEIMQDIDHPGIIKLYEIFDEPKKMHLVMELVTGGELFDRIVAKGQYTEADASKAIRALSEALDYLQAYPEAAQGIAANANCFVEQHLEMDHVLQYIQQLLVEYNKLLS